VRETGLRLALLGPTTEGQPFPDLDTTDPRLQAAIGEGRRWTRSEALDRSVILAEAIMADILTGTTPISIVPAGPARAVDPASTEA